MTALLNHLDHGLLLIKTHFKQENALGFQQWMRRKDDLSNGVKTVGLPVQSQHRFKSIDLGLKSGDVSRGDIWRI